MEITSQLCRLTVQQAQDKNVLCPGNLKHNIFTVSALDNIDYNPSSSTRVRSDPALPDFYSNLPDCILPSSKGQAATSEANVLKMVRPLGLENCYWRHEANWLTNVRNIINDERGSVYLTASWAAFHAQENPNQHPIAINDGSGWANIVSNSSIRSNSFAEAVMKVTHITKARSLHQITAATLYILLMEAYDSENSNQATSISEWVDEKSKSSSTFEYWILLLNLEILLLCFVRSIRLGDYVLFKDSLREALPWIFIFNHSNYARWLTIHLRDLEELPTKAPDVFKEFSSGNFVVRKTSNPFSALGVDHAHEQNNARVKGECEDSDHLPVHHEQYRSFQQWFISDCAALKESFLQHENPYLINGKDLLAIDSLQVVSEEGTDCLYSLEK
ncbi:unnamed protein product [Ceutorhynchus assimilis]|uniref:Uncharacterized protein n=1 Tax=Ceutorhynchus assimilis TaxID=467358 RepID=A0A9N9MW30_9CUCU|nr:unnamed protein product [Ceutorhynchus assimilis]